MSDERKLSQDELNALRQQQDGREPFYKTAGSGFKESFDAIDLLLGHIAAMEAEQQRVAVRTAKDAFEVGAVNMSFNERQTQRIQDLEAALTQIKDKTRLSSDETYLSIAIRRLIQIFDLVESVIPPSE